MCAGLVGCGRVRWSCVYSRGKIGQVVAEWLQSVYITSCAVEDGFALRNEGMDRGRCG